MFASEYFMRGNNNCAPPSVMPTQGGIYLIYLESLSELQKKDNSDKEKTLPIFIAQGLPKRNLTISEH
jgi:hypothetical protein